MRIRIAKFLKKTGAKLLFGLKRFPEALILAAIAVGFGMYLNHYSNDLIEETRKTISRITMILALGVPLSLCLKVLFERISHIGNIFKFLYMAAGAVALIFYYQFLLKDFNMVSIARYIGISLTLYLIFTFMPYFYRRNNYELYIIKLLTGFIVTYVYSLILYLGLAAIIFTIDKLFNANISSKLYFDMFLIVAGVFALGYFLSGIPEREDELYVENYPKILKVLLLNIVMPLTVAYAVILYTYFIKILVTWNWPAGIVSNLVLWFSIICSAIIFLIYTLQEKNRWIRLYIKWTPVLILPLLVMMFSSIGIRINAYGFTENRYYVVVAGLWTAGYMIYMIIRRKPRNIVLVVSLAIIAVLSVYGPVSSFSISMLSQNIRLESVLRKNGMLNNNTIVKPTLAINDKDKSEISSIVAYFDRNHSLKDVRYLPEDFKLEQSEKIFGFSINNYTRDFYSKSEYFNHSLSEESQFIDIEGYDFFLQFPYYKLTNIKSEKANLEITFYGESKELRIKQNGNIVYTGKPDDIAAKIHADNKGRQILNSDEMSYIDENSVMKVLYIFRNINGTEDKANGITTIDMPEFSMFIKLK